jgi:hypothetical protein
MKHRAENCDADREAALAHDDGHGRRQTGKIRRRKRHGRAGQLRVRQSDADPNRGTAAPTAMPAPPSNERRVPRWSAGPTTPGRIQSKW